MMILADLYLDLLWIFPMTVRKEEPPYSENDDIEIQIQTTCESLLTVLQLKQRKKILAYAYYLGDLITNNGNNSHVQMIVRSYIKYEQRRTVARIYDLFRRIGGLSQI